MEQFHCSYLVSEGGFTIGAPLTELHTNLLHLGVRVGEVKKAAQ